MMNLEPEFHPAANLFPLMNDDEFRSLVESISTKGLLEPIRMLDGQIVDGRNRFRACKQAGVVPRFVTARLGELSPVEYVLALNLDRRHLNESQRAMVAAEAKKLFADEAKERQLASQNNNTARAVRANLPEQVKTDTTRPRDKAAAALNVSPRTVEHASKVKRKGIPELAEAVTSGKVAVSTAAKLADLPKPEQRELIDKGPAAIREAVKPKPRKLANNYFAALRECVHRLDGIREVYGSIEAMFASDDWSQPDIYTATELVSELTKKFNDLNKEMQNAHRSKKAQSKSKRD